MTKRAHSLSILVLGALLAVLFLPAPAYSYGGPGSIVSGIGALLAALAAVGAAVFGFVWFPAKRIYRRFRGNPRASESEPAGEAVSD